MECIARAAMPQVDEADLEGLLAFLSARGVRHVRLTVSASSLRSRQRIVRGKVRNIVRAAEAILHKPILVAFDRVVVDGNHRYAAARIKRVEVPIILFDRPFADLLADIFAFPKTYVLHEGNTYPIRN